MRRGAIESRASREFPCVMATRHSEYPRARGEFYSEPSWVADALFARPELDAVLVFSRRPSAPPGELLIERGEGMRRNGCFDFIWIVWQRDRRPAPPQICWTLGPEVEPRRRRT